MEKRIREDVRENGIEYDKLKQRCEGVCREEGEEHDSRGVQNTEYGACHRFENIDFKKESPLPLVLNPVGSLMATSIILSN